MENLDAQLYSLAEQLDRIEEKIDGKHPVQFFDIKQSDVLKWLDG